MISKPTQTIIDLSHSINSQISVYPGTAQPQITQLSTVQHDGFAEMSLVLNSHHATHIDAPYHMIEGGKKRTDNYRKPHEPAPAHW